MNWLVSLAAEAAAPSWGDLAQLGVIALAMIVGAAGSYKFQVLHERETTAAERLRADKAEADGRELRDALMKETIPAMTLQTARSEQLLQGLQQVVELVGRVMNTALEKPK